jgi:spermidine synthase
MTGSETIDAREAGRSDRSRPLRSGLWVPTALFCLYLLGSAAAGLLLPLGFRLFSLTAGWEAAASLSVVAAVALGAVAGALLGGRRAERYRMPAAMVALLLAGFGLAVLLAPLLFAGGRTAYLVLWPLLGGTGFGAFGLRFALALCLFSIPAGLFFALPPFLSRLIVPDHPGSAIGIGFSSGLMLTGLALGVGTGGALIIPTLGMKGSFLLGVAMAGLAAGGTVLIRQAGIEGQGALTAALAEEGTGFPPEEEPRADESTREVTLGGALAAGMVLFGFAAWAYLITWMRTLTFATGGTMAGKAIVGAVFLVGIGIGAFIAAGFVDRVGVPCVYLTMVVAASSVVAYVSMHLAPQTANLFLSLTPLLDRAGLSQVPTMLAATALMLPACLMIGAALPVLPMAAGVRQRPAVGAASLIALGTVVAEGIVAMMIIPAFGLRRALSLAAAVGLLAAILFVGGAVFRRPPQRTTVSLALLAMMVIVGLFSASWDPQVIGSGFYRYGSSSLARYGSPRGILAARRLVRPIHYHEGIHGTVMVEQSFVGVAGGTPIETLALTLDGNVEAATGDDIRAQVIQGQLPILLHGPTDRVLLVGYLNGITAGSILRHPVKSLAIIEEEPAMWESADAFSAYNNDPLRDERVVRIDASARARLLADQTLYDVIIQSSMKPWRPSSAALLTSKGIAAMKARLQPGGLVAQRVQLGVTTDAALRAVLRTFADAFEHVLLFRISPVDFLAVGSAAPLAIDVGWLGNVIGSSTDVTADLARITVLGPKEIVMTYRLDRDGILSVAGSGPLNRDAHAPVEMVSVGRLDVHDNSALAGEIDDAWTGLTAVLKNYGARPQDRAEFLYGLAKSYLGLAGDADRALDVARELDGLGEAARSRWVRGESLFQQRDINGALEEWRATLDLEPDNVEAILRRDYWQAETFLKRAAQHHGEMVVVRYHFGRTLFFLGKDELAISELEKAREIANDSTQYPLVDYLVGVASLRIGRHVAAAESLKAYLDWAYQQSSLTRLEVDAHLKLADAYEKQGKRLDALRERQKGEELRRRIQAYVSQRQRDAMPDRVDDLELLAPPAEPEDPNSQ